MIDLSVVIPTRDRAHLLRGCLAGLLEQSFERHRFEVIVVDNGSHDGTEEVVREFQVHAGLELRYCTEPAPGLHRARHLGMHGARSELIVFADDDIVPMPTWLEAIHHAFTSLDASLVGGPNLPLWEVAPPAWLDELWQSTKRIGTLSVIDFGSEISVIDPCLVWGCNFSVRKSLLREARGFHPDAMPAEMIRFRGDGETHVSRHAAAKGYVAVYHPKAAVHHRVPASRMTFEYFRKRSLAQGVSESFTQVRQFGATQSRTRSRSRWKELVARCIKPSPVDWLLQLVLPWRTYLYLAMGAAHRRGFTWHQQLCLTDEEVRRWVERGDFMDDRDREATAATATSDRTP